MWPSPPGRSGRAARGTGRRDRVGGSSSRCRSERPVGSRVVLCLGGRRRCGGRDYRPGRPPRRLVSPEYDALSGDFGTCPKTASVGRRRQCCQRLQRLLKVMHSDDFADRQHPCGPRPRFPPPAQGKRPHPPRAHRSLSASIPPIGPTEPSREISPVAAILCPWTTFRPSFSITSSANASPAEGPPMFPASMLTLIGRWMSAAGWLSRRSRPPAAGVLARRRVHLLEQRLAVAQDRELTRPPIFAFPCRASTCVGLGHALAVDRGDHVVRLELADRGEARRDLLDARADRLTSTLRPIALSATAAADLLRELHVLEVDALLLRRVGAGRVDLARRVRSRRPCATRRTGARGWSPCARSRRRSRRCRSSGCGRPGR